MKSGQNIKLITALLILIVLGTSCKMGKNYSQPELESPNSFRFAMDEKQSSTMVKWWDLFDDPILDTLIQTALNYNKDVLATAHNVEAIRVQMAIQKAEMLPKFNHSGQATHGNFIGAKQASLTNSFTAFGQASWELDFWGKYRRLNEVAKAQYLASEYALSSLKLSLITTVATTYFQVLEFREKQRIAESTFAIRDSSYRLIKQRFEAGIIPEIDLHHAQIQKAIAASSIPVYKRLAAQAENALCVLTGRHPRTILTTDKLESISAIPQIPSGLPAELLNRRPDILMAEQELVAQNALVGVTQANRLPSISLTGMFGLASNELSTLTSGDPAWNIGGSLLGPLFHWNQNKNRVKAEKNRREAAIFQYQSVLLNAFRETEDALIAISTLKEERAAIAEHEEAAVQAMKLSSERYDKGIASYIEYLESQRQAFEAQMSIISNRKDLLSAYIKLYQALGGGWE